MARWITFAAAAWALALGALSGPPAFDALPDEIRAAGYGRMRELLAGRDDRAVMEIPDDTRKGWR